MGRGPDGRRLRLLLVAGESSGDRYGAHLLDAIRRQAGAVESFGIGGDRMQAAGLDAVCESREVAVVGLVEVLSRLPLFIRTMRELRRRAESERPDLAVLIDYPDFNLRLARHLKRLGVPVLYFVSPQVWAWRRGRVRTIARRVDAMAVILPFEEPIYREAGVQVEFVGHPLVDLAPEPATREESRRRFGIGNDGPVIGLLPGSRQSECRRILPILLEAARRLRERHPDVRFLVPLADTLDRGEVEEMTGRRGVPVRLVENGFYDVLQACDAAAVASGTATLEAALLGVPMVIVYRLHPVTFWIGSRIADIETIGLANLVLGEKVVPELVQDRCRPEAVAAELGRYLTDDARRRRVAARLVEVRGRLGRGGAFRNTAALALRILGRTGAATPAAGTGS